VRSGVFRAGVVLWSAFAFANGAAGQSDSAKPAPVPSASVTPRSSGPQKNPPSAKPRASAPVDFSGTWEFDQSTSINASYHYQGSVLSVTQKGDHIWIQPIKQGKGSGVLAEEIVADGRAYEKALGPAGKGTVTAGWSQDKTALWIEVRANDEGKPGSVGAQRSVWRLSADGKVWLRESTTLSSGKSLSSRAVFRRTTPESISAAPVQTARPTPKR